MWATLRIHVAALLYMAIAGITQGVSYYLGSRERQLNVARLEGQLARARLQALNAQIRPHFLFNTLHTIGHLWRSGQSDAADRMLDHLGSLFQKVQSVTSHPEVPLREELELVSEYLAIEKARFHDRLTVVIDATREALACTVPPLLLQPLVENAIRHGISASSSAGHVRVDARVDGERLVIEVTDDGPGMDAKTPSPGNGTGLSNTRERLAQLYGDAGVMEISSGDGEKGTTIRIRVPAMDSAASRHDNGATSSDRVGLGGHDTGPASQREVALP